MRSTLPFGTTVRPIVDSATRNTRYASVGVILFGAITRDLLAGRHDARIEDEVLAREAHHPRDQVLELGLGLERDRDLPGALLLAVVELVVLAGGRRVRAPGRVRDRVGAGCASADPRRERLR